ncbi:hypothetical protein STEG23_023238 [Scotinomys teguina]
MGTKALLCCPRIPLTKAVKIIWEIAPRDQPHCRIAYRIETKETNETNCTDKRITWASTPDQSPDLQISEVALDHDGSYSCGISTPNGYFQERHDLQVLVPPAVTLSSGKNRTTVCQAIAGKPAAQISWAPGGNCKTLNESHSNGTVTVRSTCQWEQSNVSAVLCFVTHSTGNQTLSIEELNGDDSSCSSKGKVQDPGSYQSEPWNPQVQETLDDLLRERVDDLLQEALFPDGNILPYIVAITEKMVPPAVTLSPGENKTVVCEATAGRPAAQIFWTPDGDCKAMNESHSNGTVTVRSTCQWEQSNVSAVLCFVTHSTGNKFLSLQLNPCVNSPLHSLLIILYAKLSLLGIILLIIGFAFFHKRNCFSITPLKNLSHQTCPLRGMENCNIIYKTVKTKQQPKTSAPNPYSECLGTRKRCSECLGTRKRYSECLGTRKRYSECLGTRKRYSECLGTRKCYSECLGTRKCYSECLGTRKRYSECLGTRKIKQLPGQQEASVFCHFSPRNMKCAEEGSHASRGEGGQLLVTFSTVLLQPRPHIPLLSKCLSADGTD